MGARHLTQLTSQARARDFPASDHLIRHGVSRRAFLRGASALTAIGGALAAGAASPHRAWAAPPGVGDVVPPVCPVAAAELARSPTDDEIDDAAWVEAACDVFGIQAGYDDDDSLARLHYELVGHVEVPRS